MAPRKRSGPVGADVVGSPTDANAASADFSTYFPMMPEPPRTPARAEVEEGFPINYAYGGGKHTYIPDLDGPDALIKYQRMRRQDETIGAMFWVMTSTLCQLPWSFTPCVNGKAVARDDPDFEEALNWAEFMDGCLTDMDHSWVDHIEEAIVMAWAGFAPCEIVLKQRDGEQSRFNDGRWGFKRLPLRDPLTIWKFEADARNNNTVMRQRTLDGKAADIPLWKVLHYRMSRVLDDPFGVSLLENAHRPWFLKNRIQESESIGIDRELCGMPTFRIPNSELVTAAKTNADGTATKEAQAAQMRIQATVAAVTKLRFNEVGGLILPSDTYDDEQGKPSNVKKWDFELIHSTGQRAIDARTAARDYDRAIARTVLMQFLHLGDRSGGSFGLSSDQSSLAVRSIMAMALKIAGEFNIKAVSLLWLVNAAPKKFMPRLDPGHLDDASIEKFGQFLADMAQAEPLFQNDPALRDAVLDRAGLKGARDKLRNVAPKPPQPDLFGHPPTGAPPEKPPSFAPKPSFGKSLAKRDLQPNGDGHSAKSPFLYDPNALGTLRPDQVPRFFGALTDGHKLPTKRLPLDTLHAMQDRVDAGKVEALRGGAAGDKKAVVVRHNGKNYIADGHHRLIADWLNGEKMAEVHFKDLEPVDSALKTA